MADRSLPHFVAPFDWDAIDSAVVQSGAAVVEKLVDADLVDRMNEQVDAYLDDDPEVGRPTTGSDVYDTFLGHKTVRLHRLVTRFEAAIDLVGHAGINDWVDRMLGPVSESHLLNAAELIQIGPGEPAQFPHRDTDSWPHPVGEHPHIVNAMIALGPFTIANGATTVAIGSHTWESRRTLDSNNSTQAELDPGDALLFRGDALHCGGENKTHNEHRRGLSISFCAGWLRPVENSYLNVPLELVKKLPDRVQERLGYYPYDASDSGGGLLGLYDNGDPRAVLG